jgi:hypothetical protein
MKKIVEKSLIFYSISIIEFKKKINYQHYQNYVINMADTIKKKN